jgi:hypothetical protein
MCSRTKATEVRVFISLAVTEWQEARALKCVVEEFGLGLDEE